MIFIGILIKAMIPINVYFLLYPMEPNISLCTEYRLNLWGRVSEASKSKYQLGS